VTVYETFKITCNVKYSNELMGINELNDDLFAFTRY